jgi:hypothetical protein
MARPESLGASGGSALLSAFAGYWLRNHLLDGIAVFGNLWPDASGCDPVTMTRRYRPTRTNRELTIGIGVIPKE